MSSFSFWQTRPDRLFLSLEFFCVESHCVTVNGCDWLWASFFRPAVEYKFRVAYLSHTKNSVPPWAPAEELSSFYETEPTNRVPTNGVYPVG